MIHHLVLYGPLDPKRPSHSYRDATADRLALGNVGLEWLVPGAGMLLVLCAGFTAAGVEWQEQAAFFAASLLWSFVVFSYLHDRMHEAGFWMERTPLVRDWFLKARKLHDIHHWDLSNDGRLDRNFGIGFYVFDRLFGTFESRWEEFNAAGYEQALQRYGDQMGARNEKRRNYAETDDGNP
jgi:sterol desaturase/sphingolipid hydroxylase (fatty acid hydroxylase superfamily)